MLCCICGSDFGYNMGNHKTYTMTLMLYLDAKLGRDVYANYKLMGIPYQPIQNLKQLLVLMEDNGLNLSIGIDEFPVYFDAYDRPNKKDGTKDVKNFVRQTRKRGVKLYYTAQSFYDVNLSIRRVTHKVIQTRKFDIVDGNLVLCERDDCYAQHILELQECMVRGQDLIPSAPPVYMPVIKQIFSMYNSEELVGLY